MKLTREQWMKFKCSPTKKASSEPTGRNDWLEQRVKALVAGGIHLAEAKRQASKAWNRRK